MAGLPVRLGFTAQNLGGKLKFNEESEELPLMLKFGAAAAVGEVAFVSVDLVAPRDNSPWLAVGAERILAMKEDIGLAGRLGYNTRAISGLGFLGGFSMGFGLSWKAAILDYALSPMGALGLAHRVSLGIEFGSGER
jgi:hypothetical protein